MVRQNMKGQTMKMKNAILSLAASLAALCAAILLTSCTTRELGWVEKNIGGKVPYAGQTLKAIGESHLAEKVPDGWQVFYPWLDADGKEFDVTKLHRSDTPRLIRRNPDIIAQADAIQPKDSAESLALIQAIVNDPTILNTFIEQATNAGLFDAVPK